MPRKLTPLPTDDTLLSVEQAAAFLKLAIRTLDVWRSTGRHGLPYIKVGGAVRYRRTDLEAWLAERTHGRAAEAA